MKTFMKASEEFIVQIQQIKSRSKMAEMSSNRLPSPINVAMRLNEHFSTDLL